MISGQCDAWQTHPTPRFISNSRSRSVRRTLLQGAILGGSANSLQATISCFGNQNQVVSNANELSNVICAPNGKVPRLVCGLHPERNPIHSAREGSSTASREKSRARPPSNLQGAETMPQWSGKGGVGFRGGPDIKRRDSNPAPSLQSSKNFDTLYQKHAAPNFDVPSNPSSWVTD